MKTTEVEVPPVQAKADEPAAEPAILDVLCACRSSAGIRPVNQDRVMAGSIDVHGVKITFLIAADGMGGYQGGEIAATLAVHVFISTLIAGVFEAVQNNVPIVIEFMIVSATCAANNAVIARAAEDSALQAMGTTFTAAVLFGNTLYVANVGDSRAYLYRNEVASALTRDDSFVRMLIDQGLLTSEEAENHPRANEITRALGSPEDVDGLVVNAHVLEPGDIVLACSDGLWKGGEADILNVCGLLDSLPHTQSELDALAQLLVDQAIARGSEDNVTAALIWIGNDGPNESDAKQEPAVAPVESREE